MLKDEERRAEYDRLKLHRNGPQFGYPTRDDRDGYQRSASWHGEKGQDFSDFFKSMFGGHTAGGRRSTVHGAHGQDLKREVPAFLEEKLHGQNRQITYPLPA